MVSVSKTMRKQLHPIAAYHGDGNSVDGNLDIQYVYIYGQTPDSVNSERVTVPVRGRAKHGGQPRLVATRRDGSKGLVRARGVQGACLLLLTQLDFHGRQSPAKATAADYDASSQRQAYAWPNNFVGNVLHDCVFLCLRVCVPSCSQLFSIRLYRQGPGLAPAIR